MTSRSSPAQSGEPADYRRIVWDDIPVPPVCDHDYDEIHGVVDTWEGPGYTAELKSSHGLKCRKCGQVVIFTRSQKP